MLLTNLLLALAAAAATTAQIMPVPSNITFANNPIPGAATTNLTAPLKAAGSNLTTYRKEIVNNKDAMSGRCGIHVIQSKCAESFDGIILRLVDWNQKVLYEGWCSGTVCAWPLLGMGDFLVSMQQDYTTSIAFNRQGTISQDAWLNTDPDPRCHLGSWNGCRRQFDCGFACGAYSVAT